VCISWSQGFLQIVHSKINLGSLMLKRYRGSAIGNKPIACFFFRLASSKTPNAEMVQESVVRENSLAWLECSS
jgi:hypothetical protein